MQKYAMKYAKICRTSSWKSIFSIFCIQMYSSLCQADVRVETRRRWRLEQLWHGRWPCMLVRWTGHNTLVDSHGGQALGGARRPNLPRPWQASRSGHWHQQSPLCIFCILMPSLCIHSIQCIFGLFPLHILHIECAAYWFGPLHIFYVFILHIVHICAYFLHILCIFLHIAHLYLHILCIFYAYFVHILCIFSILLAYCAYSFAYFLHIFCMFLCIFFAYLFSYLFANFLHIYLHISCIFLIYFFAYFFFIL